MGLTYKVMTGVLLGMPIFCTALFLVILAIVTIVVLVSLRRSNRFRGGERFEDDGSAYAEEVAETYMRLLEGVMYEKANFKYFDCSICLREFEEGEQLQRIPNCEHVFHEACLRKWFVQAQICPMCRGNIIRIPSSGNENHQNNASVLVAGSSEEAQ
jgi:hypothetical protein